MGGYYQEMKFNPPNETHVEFWVVVRGVAAFVFMFGLSLYCRCIYNRRRNSISNNRRRNYVTASTLDDDNEVELAVLIGTSSSAPPPDHVGVDPCVRQRIPQTTYESSSSFSALPFHEEMCALCQYDFMDGDSVSIIPHCSHSFHSSCISSHMDYSNRCPYCRRVITVDLAPLEHDGERDDDLDDANYQHCPMIEDEEQDDDDDDANTSNAL